jgi:hypothetical protein
MNCLRCPGCKGIMRAVDVYSEKEKCISWTCYRCGEMIDREILENRANCKRNSKGRPLLSQFHIGKPIGLTLDQFFTPPDRLTYPGR